MSVNVSPTRSNVTAAISLVSAQAAQSDTVIRPYRSFMNLSAGKLFCVMEAPSEQALSSWFDKVKMPYDSITPVELEGERGVVNDA